MKPILDPCCASRMFWFDKNNPLAIYADKRELSDTLCDGRHLEIKPDIIHDFTQMNFIDNQFKLVIFDPPHLIHGGDNSWLIKKYGKLNIAWQEQLRKGFSECFRVLDEYGVLIFKWNESQIKVSEILELTDYFPLIGHKSGKHSKTHWLVFMKNNEMRKDKK